MRKFPNLVVQNRRAYNLRTNHAVTLWIYLSQQGQCLQYLPEATNTTKNSQNSYDIGKIDFNTPAPILRLLE